MHDVIRCWVFCACLLPWLQAAESPRTIALTNPLSTIIEVATIPQERIGAIEVDLVVPDTAPTDLGIGAFVAEYDGTWYQRLSQHGLGPGTHHIRFPFDATAAIHGEPHRTGWNGLVAGQAERAGIFLWSAAQGGTVTVTRLEAIAAAAPPSVDTHRLLDLELDGLDAAASTMQGHTGQRWELRFRPDPLPINPFEPAEFTAHLEIETPAGEHLVVPAFYAIPWILTDRGDREAALAGGPGRFHLRFRPREPGRYHLRLTATWDQGLTAAYPADTGMAPTPMGTAHAISTALPDLEVAGERWDDFVRVDAGDPRFFSVGPGPERALYWPVGLNIRSVNDPRGFKCTGSRLTADRGLLAYEAYLRRLAAAGGTAVEVWMASWNLALEWRDDWPGFHGVGSYHLANAERLDRLLDLAGDLGIRVNLVINNHGQASRKCDAEWDSNPYSVERGGFLDRSEDFFTDPRALQGQQRLRRYLVARYADHPAVLGWKLWSEINLTNCPGDTRITWHQQAAKRWHVLDIYDHPITTHWSGNYRTPDQGTAFLPQLDYLCIDAYHGGHGDAVTQLLWDSTNQDQAGLTVLGQLPGRKVKPVLVTEYGGNWDAGPLQQILAEHQSAAWTALVAGHAGAPMLWWFEWVDQHDLWSSYRAIHPFLAGEDLRSTVESTARPVRLVCSTAVVWVGAWARQGRILGYLQDRHWGMSGGEVPAQTGLTITVSRRTDLPSGDMVLEWWNPDDGTRMERRTFRHPGGPLVMTAPDFHRHLAFKLFRFEGANEVSTEGRQPTPVGSAAE